ncbi:hypothetical protein, partial [Nonomuraea recticatena]|uniref:hypothetical protein n=1 Tax=Nonomuraea recticatena TaxID=46178 RepID=UPI0031F8D973
MIAMPSEMPKSLQVVASAEAIPALFPRHPGSNSEMKQRIEHLHRHHPFRAMRSWHGIAQRSRRAATSERVAASATSSSHDAGTNSRQS